MQKINEKFVEFSPPCVDNSTKIQEKSIKNQLSPGGTSENVEKTPNFTENSGDLTTNGGVSPINAGVTDVNSDSSTVSGSYDTESGVNSSKSKDLEPKVSENKGEDGKAPSHLTYESQIERDFNDFSIIYPHVSKEQLLSNESLRLFAEGKESKQLSVVYATYSKFANIIANDAILQEKARISNASGASASLSSSQNTNNAYFTREQVKAMSPEEIKQHYDLIRQSQKSW